MAFSIRQGGFKPEIKAHITTTDTPNEENEQVFAYMSTDQKDFKVLATPTFSTSTPHDNPNSRRYNETTIQKGALKGVQVANTWSEDDPIVFCTQSENTPDILTFINSGATDHCFADRSLFVSYDTLSKPSFGMSAGKDSTFDIIGKGKVEFQTSVDGKTQTVSIEGVLHTPNLRSNLISVLQLGTKDVDVFFKEGNKALVLISKGEIIMTATKIGQLYAVDVNRALTEIFITQSKQQAVSFDTWHRRLGHAGIESIRNIISGKLVDGLMTQGELSMNGLCKDCIFGKHATHPFNGAGSRETELLERIHIDIWGPSQIQSAGGCTYFMLIIDGFSSYKTIAFLGTKSADVTLNVLKAYHVKAEQQTGKKLKCIRLNMGKEWCNMAWEDYQVTHGLVFEFTILYAHQQNGAAERSMQTILNRV